MLLRQIEYFCAVIERGSFTRAAEDCFVSQSAISQQIKALERELGCSLLTRKAHKFELTPAGEHLARKGRVLLGDAERLRYEIEDIACFRPKSIRIGCLNRYDGWEMAGAVAAFVRRHPGVEVTVISDSHDGLYRRLLSGEIDLAFNDRRRLLSDDFYNQHIVRNWAYIEVSEGSSLSSLRQVTASQLVGETCIIVATPEEEKVEREYYRNILNYDCSFVRVDNLEQARYLVAGNRGFLPIAIRNEYVPEGKVIKRIPVMVASSDGSDVLVHEHSDYYIFWLRSHEHLLSGEFADILSDLFR